MNRMSPSLGPMDTSGILQGLHSSPDYKLTVNDRPVAVAATATVLGGPASFASFTVEGKTRVVIQAGREVRSAKILPSSYGKIPKVDIHTIEFEIDRPGQFTVEINDDYARAFHLFANPPEINPPSPTDPNVTYFGPGVHEAENIVLHDGQTLYLAEGAVLRAKLPADMTAQTDNREETSRKIPNFIQVSDARNVTICGRGLVDLSPLPWHACRGLAVRHCSQVRIEGITLIDGPDWVIEISQSNDVHVRNIKQISHRENSDGIDICNSQDVLVEDSFLRNNDDEICVKTMRPAPAQMSSRIIVQNCIIWNERARGLGITGETQRDIDDVLFRNCDIIHDFSLAEDCSALGILICDSGTVSNVRFEDIRVEDVKSKLVLCWVGQDKWSRDAGRGRLDGATFKNITVTGEVIPDLVLAGYNEQHRIENVTFDDLRVQGKLIGDAASGRISCNAFVEGVRFIVAPTT